MAALLRNSGVGCHNPVSQCHNEPQHARQEHTWQPESSAVVATLKHTVVYLKSGTGKDAPAVLGDFTTAKRRNRHCNGEFVAGER